MQTLVFVQLILEKTDLAFEVVFLNHPFILLSGLLFLLIYVVGELLDFFLEFLL